MKFFLKRRKKVLRVAFGEIMLDAEDISTRKNFTAIRLAELQAYDIIMF